MSSVRLNWKKCPIEDAAIGLPNSTAANGADFQARGIREGASARSGRGPQDDEVMDGAGQAHAADQPDQPRRIPELRGEHGSDQGPGTGNRSEVVAEQHPASRRVIV